MWLKRWNSQAKGSLAWPDFMTFLLYVGVVIEPIKKLNNLIRLYQEGITGFERVMDVLDTPITIQDPPNPVSVTQWAGAIDFHDVSFSYDATSPPVFDHLSLSIRAGERVAIVGPSGVGKTTIASLLLRLYEPTGGTITIDGHPISSLAQESLRHAIGIVQQDTYLFPVSVRDNIAYGNPHATEEDVVQAACQAFAHEFIMALPQGYDTIVGQRGVTLSGGQRQRLCLARVFVKNPPMVILDEATSALDAHSQRVVQDSLNTWIKGRTTIIIAHRLSTIHQAQRIIVFGPQGIIEQGTHDTLLAQRGAYAALHASDAHCHNAPDRGVAGVGDDRGMTEG